METTRQQKISRLIQKELSDIFQKDAKSMHGVIVSITKTYISPDMSVCRAYISVFPSERAEEILDAINKQNARIRCKEVRIVGDDGSMVIPTRQALDMARQRDEDLVMISPNAEPPVCRIINYSKFLYQQKKKAKEMKQKQVKVEVKEIRFGPQTDDHDYNFKLKHAQEFLSEGNKVRAYVFFRGRSILFKEQGEVLLLRFANDLEEYGKVEQMPKLEGKKMFLFLAPKKVSVVKKSQQKMDRERREAEAKQGQTDIKNETPQNGGLAANAKGAEALANLKFDEE